MHLLPPNLMAMSDLCSKEGLRYANHGVHLRVHGDNTYRVMATNGRVAAIASGPCADATDFPAVAGLESAPNGHTDALVPAKAFRDALKPALKCRKFKPVLQNAAVVVGEHVVTFATTDLESGQVTPVRQLEGRFPPVPDIIPSGPPIAAVEINGEELARLLKAACEFAGENQYVRLELHAGQPVVVRAENGSQTFVGLAVTQKDLAPENPEVES